MHARRARPSGISIFESDEEAQTALHLAAENGHASVCRILVKSGADGLVKVSTRVHANTPCPS